MDEKQAQGGGGSGSRSGSGSGSGSSDTAAAADITAAATGAPGAATAAVRNEKPAFSSFDPALSREDKGKVLRIGEEEEGGGGEAEADGDGDGDGDGADDAHEGAQAPLAAVVAAAGAAGPGPVPDGGWRAWLVLVGAFVIMIDTFGVINSFGVFQTYYETQLLRGRSSSDISWIGSLQGSLLTLLGIISGPLYDAGYIFTLTATGTFLIVFGMFMTSLCTEYWQVVLAQGLCVGGGAGLAFTPSAAVLSQYFARRRSIALGIQSVGSPLAGICFPILFSRLEPRIGFGWTTRVLAFILLGLAPIPLIFMRPRIPPPKQKRAFLDKSAFTDVPFVVWMIGGFFTFLGLYVPSFYVQLFSEEHGLASSQFSAYLVTLLNAGSVLGRLVPSFAVRYLTTFPGGSSSGRSNAMLALTAAGAGVLAYAWVAVGIRGSLGGVIAFAVLFGFCNGGVTSLPQSAVVAFVPDLARLGTRLGMAFFVVGLSVLFGSPIAGAILKDPTNEADWRGLQIYTGTTMLLGSALYALSQLLLVRRQREGVAAAAAAAAA